MNTYEFWNDMDKIFDAIVAYQEKTIEFNKKFINPWVGLGKVFDKEERNEAIIAHKNAVEIDPNNAKNWYELANAYTRAGEFDKSIQTYQKAASLGFESGELYKNLALAHTMTGKYQESIPLFEKGIELFEKDEDKAIVWNHLGNVYRKLDNYDMALQAFQRADQLESQVATFMEELPVQAAMEDTVVEEELPDAANATLSTEEPAAAIDVEVTVGQVEEQPEAVQESPVAEAVAEAVEEVAEVVETEVAVEQTEEQPEAVQESPVAEAVAEVVEEVADVVETEATVEQTEEQPEAVQESPVAEAAAEAVEEVAEVVEAEVAVEQTEEQPEAVQESPVAEAAAEAVEEVAEVVEPEATVEQTEEQPEAVQESPVVAAIAEAVEEVAEVVEAEVAVEQTEEQPEAVQESPVAEAAVETVEEVAEIEAEVEIERTVVQLEAASDNLPAEAIVDAVESHTEVAVEEELDVVLVESTVDERDDFVAEEEFEKEEDETEFNDDDMPVILELDYSKTESDTLVHEDSVKEQPASEFLAALERAAGKVFGKRTTVEINPEHQEETEAVFEVPETPETVAVSANELVNVEEHIEESIQGPAFEVSQDVAEMDVEQPVEEILEEDEVEDLEVETVAGLQTGEIDAPLSAYEEYLKDHSDLDIAEIAEFKVEESQSIAMSPAEVEVTHSEISMDVNEDMTVDMDTKNAHVWNELGNVYFNAGSFDDAAAAYSKAIDLNPQFAWPYTNLALSYVQKGRLEEAIMLYQRSIELFKSEKDKAVTWNRMGNVYRRLNDYEKAIAAYQRADDLDPGNAAVTQQSRFSLLGNEKVDQEVTYSV